MQVNEGSTLTFDVPSIFTDMDYDLVVRHEHNPNYPNPWENAKVELIRVDGPVNPEGKCNETVDGEIPFSMSPDKPYTEIEPPLCLEEGQRYQIKFTFDQYDPATPDPKANILIDSVIRKNIFKRQFLTNIYFFRSHSFLKQTPWRFSMAKSRHWPCKKILTTTTVASSSSLGKDQKTSPRSAKTF